MDFMALEGFFLVHKSSLPVLSQNQLNKIHNPPDYFLITYFNIILPPAHIPWNFPIQILYTNLMFHMRATCQACLTLFGLITQMQYAGECKL